MSSRRDFITTLVLGSGAVFLVPLSSCDTDSDNQRSLRPVGASDPIVPRTRTPQFQLAHKYLRDRTAMPAPSRTERHQIVVLGGGLSGIAAAYHLQKEGVDVVLIESEPRAGGAAVSQRIGGQDTPLGSVYFVDKNEDVVELLRAANVQDVQCPDDAFILADGLRVRNVWSDETLALVVKDVRERDQMKRFRDALAAMDEDLPSYPLPETLDARLRSLDEMSARDYLDRYQSPFLDMIANAYSNSSMGAPLARTNAYCFLNFYQSELGDAFGYPRYSFPGGISRLSQGAASRLSQIRTGEVAVRVNETNEHVTIDVVRADGEVVRYICDHAVIAVPKYQLPYLLANIDPKRERAAKSLVYAPYATIQIASQKPLVKEGSYDTWDLRTQDAYTDIINPTVLMSTSSEHVISLYVPMDPSDRAVLQNDEAFAQRVTEVMNRFTGTLEADAVRSITEIHAWGWGHGIVVPVQGSHNGIAQTASAPTNRLEFAGTDADSAPAIENAIANGTRAARRLLAKRAGRSGY